ncbi:calcium-binding protein [Microvirga solisilvae]|uniref:calcium-binding protein n=1 Tax=Microvirga solisilvae TaxID=2919498 RepID=UPI002434159C|nr:calcium-binding protein [Microvirga solisilvae]
MTDETELLGLDMDRFFPQAAAGDVGTPVLIDKDGDAEITLRAGASLKGLFLFTNSNASLGIKTAGTGITFSTTELEEGTVISVDGVAIGRVSSYSTTELHIEFNPVTTLAEMEEQRLAAQNLVRALTFTKLDSSPHSMEESVQIHLYDSNDVSSVAMVFAADRFLGDDEDNIITMLAGYLNAGDEVIGGGGNDVLRLPDGGGLIDLVPLAKFEGIETVQGSSSADGIRISMEQLKSLQKVDGGGQADDYLVVIGDVIDLRGKQITGFGSIEYNGFKTKVIVDNMAMAKYINGEYAAAETLTIAGGVVSDADRYALHKKSVDAVVHGGRTTTFADIVNKTVKGTTGKNALKGSLGNDKLYGGYGNDTLTGGYGKDVFVFNSKLGTATTDRSVNFDTIADFNVADDTLWLDNAIFKKLGSGSASAPGKLNKAFFKISTKAGDKNDFVLYNKSTGYLSYDADGSDSKYKPIEFARIGKNLKLTYDDFRIV